MVALRKPHLICSRRERQICWHAYLTNLIGIFENKALDFSKNRADGDDILGDAHCDIPASSLRSSVCVMRTTVYDRTCGSGSLLLEVGDEASSRVTLYGQEKDATMAGLARKTGHAGQHAD
jgi:type I restriction enzyme M protein